MLLCDSCNYYSEANDKRKCEFTEHIFTKEIHDMEKYPCENTIYETYLNSISEEELQKVS